MSQEVKLGARTGEPEALGSFAWLLARVERGQAVNLEAHPAPYTRGKGASHIPPEYIPPWQEHNPFLKCIQVGTSSSTERDCSPRQWGPASKGRDGTGSPERERQVATRLGSGMELWSLC